MRPVPARDWPVKHCNTFGCWLWEGTLDADGYARTDDNRLAHRVVYVAERGAIAPGLELDHLCRRRRCVAPHHLEPVTRRENLRRRSWGYRVAQHTCSAGHSMYEHGRRTEYGGRVCRICSGV